MSSGSPLPTLCGCPGRPHLCFPRTALCPRQAARVALGWWQGRGHAWAPGRVPRSLVPAECPQHPVTWAAGRWSPGTLCCLPGRGRDSLGRTAPASACRSCGGGNDAWGVKRSGRRALSSPGHGTSLSPQPGQLLSFRCFLVEGTPSVSAPAVGATPDGLELTLPTPPVPRSSVPDLRPWAGKAWPLL